MYQYGGGYVCCILLFEGCVHVKLVYVDAADKQAKCSVLGAVLCAGGSRGYASGATPMPGNPCCCRRRAHLARARPRQTPRSSGSANAHSLPPGPQSLRRNPPQPTLLMTKNSLLLSRSTSCGLMARRRRNSPSSSAVLSLV